MPLELQRESGLQPRQGLGLLPVPTVCRELSHSLYRLQAQEYNAQRG